MTEFLLSQFFSIILHILHYQSPEKQLPHCFQTANIDSVRSTNYSRYNLSNLALFEDFSVFNDHAMISFTLIQNVLNFIIYSVQEFNLEIAGAKEDICTKSSLCVGSYRLF